MNKREKIIIEENDPFYYDKFRREKAAQELTEALSNIDGSFILLINGIGGSGKSTFINMWRQELINFGNNTIIHNAVKNEISENPLVSLISELLEKVNDIQKGDRISPKIKWNFKTIGEAIDKLANHSTGNSLKLMDSFERKKIAEKEIKECMTSILKEYYTNEEMQFSQLYFFIDELDKCKPAFAVDMLNMINRILSIPEIIFIVAADASQLENSIKTIYGDGFDTNNYFKNTFNLIKKLEGKEPA